MLDFVPAQRLLYSPVLSFSVFRVVKEFKAPEKSRSAPSVKEIEVSSVELALRKKKHLEGEILTLEKQIFALETSYLENTAQIGDLGSWMG